MHYSLLLHHEEATEAGVSEERLAEGRAAFGAYAVALHDAGVLVSGEVLQPAAASTTVRLADGAMRVQDGPFADTKEKLGGVFVVDVPDLDAALAWAEQCPAASYGTVEVRPVAVWVEDGTWRSA